MNNLIQDNRKELIELANAVMPFGKYQGKLLVSIPENYYVWFHSKGFPSGKLGSQLALMHEIKVNGLEHLIYPLIKK
jgi:hypothetical protein